MIKLRRLLYIANGVAPAETWLAAAAQERRVRGKPQGCDECPLRPGGEWEDGARAALAEMNTVGRRTLSRWGCHAAEGRPCAGMRRLVTEVTP